MNNSLIGIDAGGRTRTAHLTTLGDYKTIGFDKTLLRDNVGTGTGAFSNNTYLMGVANGQYRIRQSKFYHPYFSGKSQIVECTFDTFQKEAGVTKRVGYFSSSAVAPYTANLDGFWLENDGTDYYLKAYNNGTETISVRSQAWDNWSEIHDYDFSMFTVILFDFLWLGGAVLRLWLKTKNGFVLVHTVDYSGTRKGTFTKSPSQPVRYELRGIAGDGSFRSICDQVATEGSTNESGVSRSVQTAGVVLTTIGTTYPMLAIRKQASFRDVAAKLVDTQIMVASANDILQFSLQLNPTLSAPLTYANVANSACSFASGDGTITVSTPGTILASGTAVQDTPLPYNVLVENFLAWLGSSVANVMDEIVFCGTPVTGGITTYSSMTWKEY